MVVTFEAAEINIDHALIGLSRAGRLCLQRSAGLTASLLLYVVW